MAFTDFILADMLMQHFLYSGPIHILGNSLVCLEEFSVSSYKTVMILLQNAWNET